VVQQPLDAHGDVVVDAEARGVCGHRVVQSAAEVDAVGRLASPHRFAQGAGAFDDPGAGLVHAEEGRDIVGADAQMLAGVLRVERRGLDRLDEVGLVDGVQPRIIDHVRG
jgi:hypothetical protein